MKFSEYKPARRCLFDRGKYLFHVIIKVNFIIGTMLFLPLLAIAYPINMINNGKRFPESREDDFMGFPMPDGVYDESMISETVITCEKALYVIGFLNTSLPAQSDLGNEKRYISNEGVTTSIDYTGDTVSYTHLTLPTTSRV